MSFEEEFDKIIRQKSEEMDFPFDEKQWANASALIESDKKAARVLKLKKALKPALALVTLATVALITWTNLNDQTELSEPLALKPLEQQNENTRPMAKNLGQANQNTSLSNSEKNMPEHTPAQTSDQILTEPANEIQEQRAQKSQSKTKESVAFPSSKPKEESPLKTGFESTASENENTNDALKNTLKVDETTIISGESATSQLSNADALLVAKQEQEISETPQSEQTVSQSNEITSFETRNSVDLLTGFQLSLPAEQTERTLDADKMMTIINYDNAYFKAKRKTHYLNLEAGAAYLMGWNTSSDQDGKGFDYFAGINYGFYLSNKLSLGIGVQGYNVAHMNDPYYASSHKEYDFGSTTIYTVVTCSELFYAAIPIKLNYILNKANSFGIGLNAAYLMNANVNTESYYYQDNAKIQTGSSSQKAIYEGIDQYNYMLTAHYSHRFGKRIALNVEGMYGLTDLFKNTEDISSTERSNGIRLSVSYTLFDK